MHTKDAAKAGETPMRLNLSPRGGKAAVFTEVLRMNPGRTLQSTATTNSAIASRIAIIDAFNRLNVILQRPAGDYRPGQFRQG
jgi:hypothetical protein